MRGTLIKNEIFELWKQIEKINTINWTNKLIREKTGSESENETQLPQKRVMRLLFWMQKEKKKVTDIEAVEDGKDRKNVSNHKYKCYSCSQIFHKLNIKVHL